MKEKENICKAEVERLLESEKRFRLLVEMSPNGIAFYQEGLIVYVNPAGLDMIGAADPKEILGKPVLSIVHPDSLDNVVTRMKLVAEGGAAPLMEEKVIRLDGTVFDAEVFAVSTVFNDKPAGHVVVRDITEKKRAEAELREKEIQYHNLADSGMALIWTSGTDKLCNYFNEPWLKFTGRTLEQELGNGWAEGVHPDDLDRCYQTYVIAFDNHEKFDMEYRLRHADGEYRWIRDVGKPNYNGSGEFIGYIGHCLDITEHKYAEQALQDSQALYHSFVENMPAGVFRKDSEGRFVFVNSMFSKLKEVEIEKVLGKKASEVYRIGDSGSYEMKLKQHEYAIQGDEHHAEILRTGKPIETEEAYSGPDGTIQHLQVIKSPVFSSDGKVIGSQGILFDITGRKQAEEKLSKSEAALKEAQLLSRIGNWDYDVATDKATWSEEMFKIFERNLSEGEPSWLEHKACIYHEDWEKTDQAVQKAIEDGTPYKLEFRIIKPDNGLKWAFTIGKAIKDANGKICKLYGTVQDITEHKIAEAELLAAKAKAEESNRLKSAFLANLSHEVRTPMNAIIGFSNLIMEGEDDEKNAYASIIQKSSNRLLALIDDVIHISRLQSEKMPVSKTSFRPALLVADVCRMFKLPDINKGLEIVMNVPNRYKELVILSDADKISQVLSNLASNAIKYTREGSIELGFDLHDDVVEFYVKDTGMGIPAEEQEHIFDTFYRSERVVSSAIGGSGLGLSISKELIGLLGGRIGVSSVPEQGSRFYFTIPFVPSLLEVSEEIAYQSAKNNMRDFTVLIADDEPINFQYLKILLKDKVKRIDHAINGEVAVELASKNDYNLILMDIKMPVMNGIEATRILKKQYPGLPIIAQTAYSLPEDRENALLSGCDEFISKPIKKEHLMEIIDKYL